MPRVGDTPSMPTPEPEVPKEASVEDQEQPKTSSTEEQAQQQKTETPEGEQIGPPVPPAGSLEESAPKAELSTPERERPAEAPEIRKPEPATTLPVQTLQVQENIPGILCLFWCMGSIKSTLKFDYTVK